MNNSKRKTPPKKKNGLSYGGFMNFLKKKGYLVAAIAGLVALVFYLFLDAYKAEIMGYSSSQNGLDAMLGKDGGEFVLMMLVAVAAMVAGAVISYLSASKEGDTFKYAAAACFAVAAILCFLTKNFVLSANDASAMKSYFDLGIGAILAGICSLVAAAAVIAPKFLKD